MTYFLQMWHLRLVSLCRVVFVQKNSRSKVDYISVKKLLELATIWGGLFLFITLYYIIYMLIFYYLLLLFRDIKSEQAQGKMLLDSSSAVMSLGTKMLALAQKSLLPPDTETHYTCQSPNHHFSRFFF